ncbi:MAG: hypothetical protein K6U80_14885 [Firmicutes bacterium]|nr:hypothetical protein [Bacillota bacterium]
MKEAKEELKKGAAANERHPKTKQPAELNVLFDNYKTAEKLGEGRWRYHGKIYKEESV